MGVENTARWKARPGRRGCLGWLRAGGWSIRRVGRVSGAIIQHPVRFGMKKSIRYC